MPGPLPPPERQRLVAIAADIERRLPHVVSGSLSVFGDIFGGRFDNFHTVVGAGVDEHAGCLVVAFDGGEALRVWDPRGVTVSEESFMIRGASRVRWEWFHYGRPQVPENRHYIEHTSTADGVGARTDVSFAPARFSPSPDRPAVELLGHP